MASADFADLGHEQTPDMLERRIDDGRAWTRDSVRPRDCIVPLGKAGVDEVFAMVEEMAASPLPLWLRHPDHFEIPALRAVMARAKALLDGGPGVAIIDRLPIDDIGHDAASAVSWVLGHLIARPVAQKWDGSMLYDVTDTGQTYGYGVRGSATSVELVFHTDNAFAVSPPDYVGLLCYYPALEGGLSRFCSLYSVHNRMLDADREALARLYRPLYWDRQAEHRPGAPKVALAPMFRWDGKRLVVRANTALNEKGYQVAGEAMDDGTRSAIERVKGVTAADDLWFELPIERGQIQYLNNVEVAHYRSAFKDNPDPKLKRHLVRTWHRDWGRPTYDG